MVVVGDPEFEFSLTDMGGAANDPPATYDRTRSTATTIVFTYTVQAGDRDNNGIWIGNHSRTFMLDANDRIRTASQQIDIDRSHPEYGTHTAHKVDGSLGAPTVPPDPTAPTLVSATATTLTIEWTHPGDGGSPLTRNFIEYRVEGTTDWTNWYRGETPTPVTRTVITNLAAETAYDVRVHATNAIGNSSWVQSATAFSTLAGMSTNTAATGAPAITGTAAVGQVLAVDLTGIEDADGLTNVSYSYQWVRVDADGTSNPADIADATDATYTLVDADLGKTLKVRVTFDDDGGHTETLTSAATATVTPAAGTPSSPRNLSATVGVGQVVLVWERPDNSTGLSHYEYRSSAGEMIAPDAMWQQVQNSDTRPNQAYYQVVKGLTGGTTHTLQVRAVNAQGASAPAIVPATPLSQPSCTIDELGDRRRLWQGQLTVGIREIATDGKIKTGYGEEEGTEETGTLTPDAVTFRSTTYSVTTWTSLDHLNVVLRDPDSNNWFPREEVVDALRLHVCNTPYDFSDATVADVFAEHGDYRWDVGFNWPPGIERTLRLSLPPNHPATGDPVISGTVQVGQTLTAVTTGIMDDDGLDDVFTYQWVRVDADGTSNEEDITDETDATYTLTADDRGKKVKVEVRFVDILGGEETRTSAPTETVPGVTVSTTALTVTEEDTTGASYTVVLNSQPTANVTVTVAGHAGTDVTPSPTSLTFTPTTWGTAQTVTVTAGDDAVTANDTVTLTHSAASTDSEYQGITIAGGAVTVTDNDDNDTAPGAPRDLRTAPGDGRVTLAWTAPGSDGGAAIEKYRYRVSANAGSSWDPDWTDVPDGPDTGDSAADETTFTVSGLINGTEYVFELRAVNSVGEGPAASAADTPVRAPLPPGSGFLVGNFGQRADGAAQIFVTQDIVGVFKTGARGAELHNIEFRLFTRRPNIAVLPIPSVTLYRASVTDSRATRGARVAALTAVAGSRQPANTAQTVAFAAPSGTRLDAGATYLVVLEHTSYVRVESTTFPAEDAGGAPGWAIDGIGVGNNSPYSYQTTASLLMRVNGTTASAQRAVRAVREEEQEEQEEQDPDRGISLSTSSSSAIEGEAVTIGVRRAGPTDRTTTVAVQVLDSALTGAWPIDVELRSGVATTTATVAIPFDGARPASRTVTVSLASVEEPYSVGSPSTLTFNVTDRDAALSVHDASVSEGPGATLAFAVTLDRTRDREVRVKYATSDGTATQGEDYTGVSGTLRFAAGETTKTVSVPVLDDAHDEGSETLTLTLTSPRRAVIDDGTAVGTIINSDPLPDAWLSRFGRAASDHVVQSIGRRLEGGESESHLTVMGWRVDTLLESTHSERDGREPRADAPGRQPEGSVAPDGRTGAAGAMAGGTRGFGAMSDPGAARPAFDGAMTQGFPPMQGGTLQSPACGTWSWVVPFITATPRTPARCAA